MSILPVDKRHYRALTPIIARAKNANQRSCNMPPAKNRDRISVAASFLRGCAGAAVMAINRKAVMKYWKWGNRAMTEATLAEQLQQVRQYAQELKDQGFVSYPWEYEEISLALFAVCEAAEQFKSAKAQAAYWEGLADAQQRNGYYTQLKAAERRIMLLEEQLKQCRAKLEAAQAANDPATIQEYADYYSVAAQQFPATGEAPMTYDEWLADAQEANEGGIITPA